MLRVLIRGCIKTLFFMSNVLLYLGFTLTKTMRITKRKNSFCDYNIHFTEPFFKLHEFLILEYDEYGIYFKVPSIDDQNTIKIHQNSKNSAFCNVYGVELKEGFYKMDEEESNEDIIYFNW